MSRLPIADSAPDTSAVNGTPRAAPAEQPEPQTNYSSDIAFTATVKEVQRRRGSRAAYARMEAQRGGFAVEMTDELAAFIAQRDSAFLATANALGQPYVQHRGGPAGFIHVLDKHTVAFADFAGNKQYISTGNLAENGRAFLFLMDYEHRERMKLWGRAKVITDDSTLLTSLSDTTYGARVEAAIVSPSRRGTQIVHSISRSSFPPPASQTK